MLPFREVYAIILHIMFLGLPLANANALQKTALILCTVVLLVVLIVGELTITDLADKQRHQVKY